jgi:hypothetical protein
MPVATILEISQMGKRKQPSGYQNRKRRAEKVAAAQAAGTWMPPLPTLEELSSLTAITATRHGAFCLWLQKRLSTDDWAVFLRTLSEFRSDAVARIQERDVENDERMIAALEAHESRVSGLTLTPAPALEQSPGPVGGELMPRETNTDGAAE